MSNPQRIFAVIETTPVRYDYHEECIAIFDSKSKADFFISKAHKDKSWFKVMEFELNGGPTND